jgi:hypothetical protein
MPKLGAKTRPKVGIWHRIERHHLMGGMADVDDLSFEGGGCCWVRGDGVGGFDGVLDDFEYFCCYD